MNPRNDHIPRGFDRRGSQARRRLWRSRRTGYKYVLAIIIPAVITGVVQFAIDQMTHAAERAWWRHYAHGVAQMMTPVAPK